MTLEASCPACAAPFKPDAAFCAACGRRRATVEPAGLGFAIRFYLVLLAVNAAGLLLAVHSEIEAFVIMSWGTAALAAVTFAAAAVHHRLVIPAYRRIGFSLLGYALILLAAPVIVALVGGYVVGLAHLFGIEASREGPAFADHGVAARLALVVMATPVFEELAFRGLIFGALAKTMRRGEAYVISSFAFALLHLAPTALVTHFPLGLYLCWLRERSKSMYPSMLAHACHNLGVIVAELLGWW